MKLHELISKYSDSDISDAMKSEYPDEDFSGYLHVLGILREMTPVDSGGFRIVLHACHDADSGYYTAVSGRDGRRYCDLPESYGNSTSEEEVSWGLDFTDWSKWLDMEIDDPTLWSYTEVQVIAHVLWEMTFHGYDESEIKGKEQSIHDSLEEYKASVGR